LKAGRSALDDGSYTEAEGLFAAAVKVFEALSSHAFALADLGLEHNF
jgi:hypothetical protein